MSDERWFYRDDAEWAAVVDRLKRTPCPHCRAVGTLNRHGSLHGYDDSRPRRTTLRARRVFCSNRHRRPGCGRTTSVWIATKIRRSSLTTGTLGAFVRRAVRGGLAPAIRAAPEYRSPRSWRRVWRRFDLAQSRLRTALLSRGPPPGGPPAPGRRPDLAHTLAHLAATFPHAADPLAAFQSATRSFVL
ncbi:hypothetical protein [Limnoglobus roseus]|uniref:Transposase n=1 Tax=Limnoglobus roseus TaxID=2598579 RepID=A0A5C1ADR2_9BACT|nr:hypothetical protein [Limnoglobus roseus]QEL16785.1 hypothetical protein PX52LOC_03758 [Limnoglobus roseus]